MPGEERGSQATMTVKPRGPHWRALLETRWQARLREVTELSLAYHVAAAATPGGSGHGDGTGNRDSTSGGDGTGGDGDAQPEIRALLRQTVAARRKLADVEEALGRLAAGRFGSCEQCGSPIPAGLLTAVPETRYCPRCDPETARVRATAR